MNPLQIGALVCVVTIIVLLTGVPVAFGLGFVALLFLLIFQGNYQINFRMVAKKYLKTLKKKEVEENR